MSKRKEEGGPFRERNQGKGVSKLLETTGG